MFWVVFSLIDNFLRFVTQLCLLATIQCLPNVDFIALSYINSKPQTSLWKPAGVFLQSSNTAHGPVVLGPRNIQTCCTQQAVGKLTVPSGQINISVQFIPFSENVILLYERCMWFFWGFFFTRHVTVSLLYSACEGDLKGRVLSTCT